MVKAQSVGAMLARAAGALATLGALALAGPASSAFGLDVSRVEDRILDPDAHARITYENTVNIASYQQDGVLTYNGYQYTAWYQNSGSGAGAATSVVARRALPNGDWESAHLDHPLWSNDSHNTIALGVTPSDGRLHVTFPTHDAPVRYTRSIPGLLDDPEGHDWSSALFDSVYSLFPGAEAAPQTFTYPQFENVQGETLVTWRDGITNNGRQAVLRYDNNAAGTWSFLGRFSHNTGGTYNGGFGNSTTRYGYIHGFTADPGSGDLAVTLSWREQNAAWCGGGQSVGNHDLGYAVSDDAGLRWQNNDGELVAETTLGSTAGAITPFTNGIVVEEIGINKGLINQETQSFDSEGRLHVVTSRVPDEDIGGNCVNDFYPERAANARPYHHWRDADGTWSTFELPFRSGSAGRTKIAFDSDDNAYVVLPDARIVAASAGTDWTDWELVFDDPEVSNVSETIIDRQRVRDSDILTVAYQEPPPAVGTCRTNQTSSQCRSAYRLASFELGSDAPDAPRSTSPEAAPVPFEGYADDALNLALNRDGDGFPEIYAHQDGQDPHQPDFPPSLANDGDIDSFWVSGTNTPGLGPTPGNPVHLGVDLGEAHPLGEVQMIPRPNFGPTDYTIEVSDEDAAWGDVETWTQVAEVTNATNSRATTPFLTTEARHLRLRITGSRDTAGQPPRNTQVAELRVFARDDAADTEPPDVSASITGEQNDAGSYINRAVLTLEASDDSGVHSVEYAVDGGDWEEYTGALVFEDAGVHTVAYRATDFASNTSDLEAASFRVVVLSGCGPLISDEFQGTELDTDLWSFRHPTTPADGSGAPRVEDGSLVLPLGSWSLDLNRDGPVGLIGQPLPEGDFTLTTRISAPGLDSDTGSSGSLFYAQAGIKLYQSDDDWVKVAHTRNADGGPSGAAPTYFELGTETGGTRTLGPRIGMGTGNLPTWWLQIIRSGDQLTAAYATGNPAQTGWNPLTVGGSETVDLSTIFNPADGPVYIGPFGGSGAVEASYEFIRFEPEALDCADTTPPVTTHTLVPSTPGDGGTYQGPVSLTLSASDTGEGASGVAGTFYRTSVDGEPGQWEAYNPAAPPQFSSDGNHLVEYYSTDSAGNVEDPPGGVEFAIEAPEVGEPDLRVNGIPNVRRVGPNRRQVRYQFRARNVGDGPSGRVNLCVRAPARRVNIRGARCVRRQIPAGERRQRAVVVRIKRPARGKVTRIRLIARGPNVVNRQTAVRLRVRR